MAALSTRCAPPCAPPATLHAHAHAYAYPRTHARTDAPLASDTPDATAPTMQDGGGGGAPPAPPPPEAAAAAAAAAAAVQDPGGAAADAPAADAAGGSEAQPPSPRKAAGCMQHGCEHYKRRCKLVAPCCGEVFWCRHCHNSQKDDAEQDPARRHRLDRKLVQEVICVLCDTRQPVGDACGSCGVAFGRYTCMACKFFDDDVTKQQFHCADCGICRVGGRHNFFHCGTCNCCYSVSLRDSHVCVTNSMHANCPVCYEYLFDSIRPIAVLTCGHTIHQSCHRDLMAHDTITCPLCLKCILSDEQKAAMWSLMDEQVRNTPMPEEYRSLRVTALCNDCSARSEVPFHVVGHKCGRCGGYNTRRVGAD